MSDNKILYAFTQSITFATIILTLRGIELNSRTEIEHLDSEYDLENVYRGIKYFIIYALIWVFITTFIMYKLHGMLGVTVNILINAVLISWILITYYEDVGRAKRLLMIPQEPCDCHDLKKVLLQVQEDIAAIRNLSDKSITS